MFSGSFLLSMEIQGDQKFKNHSSLSFTLYELSIKNPQRTIIWTFLANVNNFRTTLRAKTIFPKLVKTPKSYRISKDSYFLFDKVKCPTLTLTRNLELFVTKPNLENGTKALQKSPFWLIWNLEPGAKRFMLISNLTN